MEISERKFKNTKEINKYFEEKELREKEEKERLKKEEEEILKEKTIKDEEVSDYTLKIKNDLMNFAEKSYKNYHNDREVDYKEWILFYEKNCYVQSIYEYLIEIKGIDEYVVFNTYLKNDRKTFYEYKKNIENYVKYIKENMNGLLTEDYFEKEGYYKDKYPYDLKGEIPLNKGKIDFELIRNLVISRTKFLFDKIDEQNYKIEKLINKNEKLEKIIKSNSNVNYNNLSLENNNFSDLEKKINEDNKNSNKNLKKKQSVSSEKSDISEYSKDSNNGDINLITKKIDNFINNVKKCYEENNNFDNIEKYHIQTKDEILKFCKNYSGLTNEKPSTIFKGLATAKEKRKDLFFEWSKENIFMRIIKNEISF